MKLRKTFRSNFNHFALFVVGSSLVVVLYFLNACGVRVNEPGFLTVTSIQNNQTLYSGFIFGTATAVPSLSAVEVSFDGASFTPATGTTSWSTLVPTGPTGWKDNTRHSLSIRGKNSSGNVISSLALSITKGTNLDVNGDGYPDFTVGAYQNAGTSGIASKGAIYVYYGTKAGISSHPFDASPYTCSGVTSGCAEVENPRNESGQFGYSISSAGDINGDGYADIIVTAATNHGISAGAQKGAAYVFYGSKNGIAAHPMNSVPYSCSGISDGCTEIENPRDESGRFGWSLAPAGDVNGDGYPDFILGAANNQGSSGIGNKGAAYLFYGSSTGLAYHPIDATSYSCTGVAAGCTEIESPYQETSSFGKSVSTAGDINGDGYSDIVIGASSAGTAVGKTFKGAAYVFYGGSNGVAYHPFDTNPYTCSGVAAGCTEMQNPRHEAGFFASSVAPAGDINGDGYPDLVVTSSFNQGGFGFNIGADYIIYGGSSGPAYHPLGTSPYSCAGPSDGCTEIENPRQDLGGTGGGGGLATAILAGDMNGDGYPDLLIQSENNRGSTGVTNKGAVYIFYGSKTGIAAHPIDGIAYPCTGPSAGCTEIQNPSNFGGYFGQSISFIGDINGDGFPDVAVGAFQNMGTSGMAGKGAAYIIYGGSGGPTYHPIDSTTYTCSGAVSGCTEIENPNQEGGSFGFSVGFH